MTSQPTSKKRTWLRWLWDNRFALLLLFATYAIGVVFGFACRRYLVFKREVGIGDILNAATLIFVAIVLQNLALRQFSNIRAEKDILISCVNEVLDCLKDAHKMFLQKDAKFDSVDKSAMQSAFKHFSNSLYALEKALEAAHPRAARTSVEGLKDLRGGYRKQVLGGGFPTTPYSVHASAEEEKLYLQMRIDLQALVFEINRE